MIKVAQHKLKRMSRARRHTKKNQYQRQQLQTSKEQVTVKKTQLHVTYDQYTIIARTYT